MGYGIHKNGEKGELFDGTKDSFVQFVNIDTNKINITNKDFGFVNDCNHFYEKNKNNTNVNARQWIFLNVIFPIASRSANRNIEAIRNAK